jgi:putative addiction module component (TIGR02574 family)
MRRLRHLRAGMSLTLQQFGLDTHSLTDRVTLAEALWESIHDSLAEHPVTPDIDSEFQRRIQLADTDPTRGMSWESVRAAARGT